MNSSGIKRGLASTAVAALAVTGLPFLASSADAAVGDSFSVVSSGPALNGGTNGAVVTIRFKDGTITPSAVKAVGTSGTTTGTEDTADQNVQVVGAGTAYDDPSDSTYDLVDLRVAVTTATTGDTATFRLFEDDNAGAGDTANTLDADEARTSASVSTAGALASIDVAPATQSVAQGETSGDYTVTAKDSAGRTTQLASGDDITVATDSALTPSTTDITAADIATGSTTFSVDAKAGATNAPTGTYDITLTDSDTTSIKKTVKLTVTPAATLTTDEVDIVTGADSWDGFGNPTDIDGDGTKTLVRVDQSSIRIDIADSTPNGTVTLDLTGAGIKFGGKTSTTITTVLDKDGNGSLTITPDAGTVQVGDTITVSGSGFSQTLEFQRAAATHIAAGQPLYFGKLGGSVDITAMVTDQFGEPVTTGFVGAQDVSGPNASSTQKVQPIGNDGSATFTFTDTKATNGQEDVIGLGYAQDQYVSSPSPADPAATKIRWTTTGQGADFNTLLQGEDTGSSTYKNTDANVDPLADAHADDSWEYAEVDVEGAEPNQDITVTVDNGALLLPLTGTDSLADGKSSVEGSTDGSGVFDEYEVVGTKAGVVNVTISSANRTETVQMTVNAETDLSTARNVTLSGPSTVPNDTSQISYTAVVTDAFGNPVANLPRTLLGSDVLNIQVSGPGHYQDGDSQTNENGELTFNVGLDSDAVGDVTVKVTGQPNVYVFGPGSFQFGAAADHVYVSSSTADGKGLPVSSNVGTATTTVEAAPEPPVTEPVAPHMKMRGIDKGKRDVIRVNAIDAASGATVKLFKRKANGHLKKIKTAVLNEHGNFTFRTHDGNGNRVTRYTVKLVGNEAVRPAVKSRRVH